METDTKDSPDMTIIKRMNEGWNTYFRSSKYFANLKEQSTKITKVKKKISFTSSTEKLLGA